MMENKKEEYLLRKERKENERLSRIRRKKIKKFTFLALPIILVAGVIFIWLNDSPEKSQNNTGSEKPKITVFYSPNCSCCVQYLSYLRRNGFEVSEERDMAKRMDILEKYQIPSEMEACHTSVIGDYFVEGHMPVEVINKLLEEKPEISGIALAGMPQGSPGMPGFKIGIGKWTIYSLTNGQPSEFITY